MSVYIKLQEARMKLQNTALKKSGHNKFAGYYYFELGDFLPAIQRICSEMGLCGIVAFTSNMAYLTINDTEDGSFHGPEFTGYLGFDHDEMKKMFEKAGFKNIKVSTCHEIVRTNEQNETRVYPLFLMTGEKE